MTVSAQGNEVEIVVVPLTAAQLFVMDLKVLPGTTGLASPVVAAQYLFSELAIWLRIEPQAGSPRPNRGSRSLLGYLVEKCLPLLPRFSWKKQEPIDLSPHESTKREKLPNEAKKCCSFSQIQNRGRPKKALRLLAELDGKSVFAGEPPKLARSWFQMNSVTLVKPSWSGRGVLARSMAFIPPRS